MTAVRMTWHTAVEQFREGTGLVVGRRVHPILHLVLEARGVSVSKLYRKMQNC